MNTIQLPAKDRRPVTRNDAPFTPIPPKQGEDGTREKRWEDVVWW